MKKQLNVESIQSELRGGSAFFPGYKSPPTPPSEDVQSPSEADASPQQSAPIVGDDHRPEIILPLPERVNARTPVRPSGKRIITRNSFEIYEDQMDSLRKLSLEEKMEGNLGSMSQMVREAIDTYLKTRHSQE